MELSFGIPGPPVTWKRVNIVNGRAMKARGQKAWSDRVRAAAWLALVSRQDWPRRLEDATRFDVTINVTEVDGRRGDLDNYAKGIMDPLNGLLWKDDRQIDRVEVKRWPPDKERPGVSVMVRITA